MNLPKMIPINNSDTAWLIVSDFNQENDLPYKELREDIANPDVNDYHFEFISSNHVGTEDDMDESDVEDVGDGNTLRSEMDGRYVGGYINQWVGGGFVGSVLFISV